MVETSRDATTYLEEQLLLALLLGQQAKAERLAAGVDWVRMAQLMHKESVGGYLHRALPRSGLDRLAPSPFLETASAAYRKTTYDNLLLLGRLQEAGAALNESGVPFIVLKGGALIFDLYPDAGMRSLSDIDLLVPHDRAASARRTIERLGWRKESGLQVAARRCGYSTPKPGSCLFEIHWDLSQRYRFQADLDRIWAEARPLDLDGLKAARLGDEDELLYLSLHYGAHYFGLTVKWLVDLVDLIRRRTPDWGNLGQRARGWRGSASLHAALLFVRRSAPELLSQEAVDRAGRHPIADRLLALYESDNPLRFLKELPYGPVRLLLAALLQDRMRDRAGLAWLTQVRGYRPDE